MDAANKDADACAPDETTDETSRNNGETPSLDKAPNVFSAPSDPFAYVNKIHTNEMWKLHVSSIPKYVGYQAFRKKMAHLGLSPTKIKLLGKGNDAYAFLVFKSKEDMDHAFSVLDSLEWKSCKLQVKHGKPAADPFVKKQEQRKKSKEASAEDGTEDAMFNRLKAVMDLENEDEKKVELNKLLCENTEPWCTIDYPEQLSRKTTSMKAIMKPLVDGQVEFRSICPSPILEFYRNKIEFTIGYGVDGKPSVGFRIGSYRSGSCYVHRPEPGHLKIVPKILACLAASFENYVRSPQCNMRPFNQVTHEGNFRLLTCRMNSAGQVIAIIGVFTGNLRQSPGLVEKERESLLAYFDEEKRKEFNLEGLLWHGINFGSNSGPFADGAGLPTTPELLFGKSSIIEELCGLKFKISPQSFFQINTRCTEVLYSLVREFAFEGEAGAPKLILDLCCGTGTIGLVLAAANANVKVAGIELCESAVEDARENAKLNDITESRVTYICDKVENALYGLLARSDEAKSEEASIVAILDPPRAGVHTSVIKTIRKTAAIKRLVYVSCNAASAFGNFDNLIADPSRRLVGDPFHLKRLVPIDLFPHTSHCELVLLFER